MTDGKGYNPAPTDEPLGRFVYIVPIDYAGHRPPGGASPLME